ncbi:ABC transporter permease [Bacteriovorax sp. Seq25_V]|uniref:ABC transporter permease n=1 Tax=Bacteriovorax sp. Seq25_V TaxID=1201288 RepID=UPI00038A5253|nr:ABC transporter permease [Bacteriovorax sp. Seq25_V]EQC44066.1 ABC-2 family transporter protein [Bacteriovorax sp. Seq25_V]
MLNYSLVQNTIQKEIRNKGVIFLFLMTLISLYLGHSLAVGVKEYVDEANMSALIANSTQAIIITFVSTISIFVSIIIGISAIRSDQSLRILPQILSFPISRLTYIMSRITGAWALSVIFYAITVTFGILILKFSGAMKVDFLSMLMTFGLMLLSLLTVTFVASFISVYLNKIASFILTIVFYLISKFSYYNFINGGFEKAEFSISKVLGLFAHYCLPRIGELNYFSEGYLSGKTFDSTSLVLALVHFFCVIIIWGYIFKFLFERREI